MLIWGRVVNIDLDTLLQDLGKEAEPKWGMNPYERVHRAPRDIFVKCPNLEGHGGDWERTPSCSISREDGRLHCFGCDYKDSLPGLVARTLRLPKASDGFRWIMKHYQVPERGARPKLELKQRRLEHVHALPEEVLELYQFDHPYMFQRGLTTNIIDLFDVGFDQETNAITLPMRDELDRLYFIKKRPLGRTKFHKYSIDHGVEKADILYGLNIIKKNIERVKMIWLCEGEFDVLACYCAKKYGAGMQGADLLDPQLKKLIRHCRGIPICIFTDNDKTGRENKYKIAAKLRPYFKLYEPVYPSGNYKDPNDLLKAGLLENIEARPM